VDLLTTPWFWVGLSVVAAAISLAWLASHGSPAPLRTARPPGRSDTRRDRSEFKDDPYLR
jgi:hypothetical protein